MTNLDETYLLDPLNGIPHPPSLIPDPTMEEYAGEAEMNRQQRKRKRLASEDVSAHQFAPYGHKGQVVPGPLKLEVVDVNTHESNTCKDTLYQANILRRNWSVYATQTDHCDVILEHKAQVPFSLTKLVIKVPIATTYRQPSVHPLSPSLNFTKGSMLTAHRIGEGLLFVAMTASDFSRTVHYRLRSTTPSADPTHGRGTYFHFHDRPPSRRADNGINPAANGWQQLGAHWVRPAGRIHHRSSADPYSPQRVLSPPIPDSAFQVRAARDDPSSESEYASGDDSDASTISSHHTPERRSRARSDTPRPTSSPTPPAEFLDDEQQPDASMVALVRQRMRGPIDQGVTDPGAYVSSNSRRRRLNKERDSMGSTDAKSEMDKDGQDSGILRPQARFFFGKGKTRVSVKLDPPV